MLPAPPWMMRRGVILLLLWYCSDLYSMMALKSFSPDSESLGFRVLRHEERQDEAWSDKVQVLLSRIGYLANHIDANSRSTRLHALSEASSLESHYY